MMALNVGHQGAALHKLHELHLLDERHGAILLEGLTVLGGGGAAPGAFAVGGRRDGGDGNLEVILPAGESGKGSGVAVDAE